jgi:hypothetical protein
MFDLWTVLVKRAERQAEVRARIAALGTRTASSPVRRTEDGD